MFKVGDIVIYIGEHQGHYNYYGSPDFEIGIVGKVITWSFSQQIEQGHVEVEALEGENKGYSQRVTLTSLVPATELNKLLYT